MLQSQQQLLDDYYLTLSKCNCLAKSNCLTWDENSCVPVLLSSALITGFAKYQLLAMELNQILILKDYLCHKISSYYF